MEMTEWNIWNLIVSSPADQEIISSNQPIIGLICFYVISSTELKKQIIGIK